MHDIAPIPYRETVEEEIAKGESLKEIPEVLGAADAYMSVAGLGALSNYNDLDRSIAHHNGRDLESATRVIRGAAIDALMNIGYESRS